MAHSTTAALTIECSDQPLDLSFHPTKATLLAAALVDGTVEVHDFAAALAAAVEVEDRGDNEDDDDDTIVSSTAAHSQLVKDSTTNEELQQASCRAVQFSADGASLWTGGSDGDVVCLDAATVGTFTNVSSQNPASLVRFRISEASHQKSPIHVLHELGQSGLLASGDDAGGIRVWDPRIRMSLGSSTAVSGNRRLPVGCVASWNEHDDYVSALQCPPDDDKTLLATSADGTLSVYDLRMAATAAQQPHASQKVPGVVRRSDFQDDELLSLCILKNGRKVVCGTTEGVLAVFSYGRWGDVSDRFPGHPSSIDAILKVDENTILTGSSDGYIRVVSIHPDKLIGVLGDNHEGFPIEKLQFSCDRSHVGSLTHDNYVRLWDASVLLSEDLVDGDHEMSMPQPLATMTTTSAKKTDSDEEWEDMDEEMADENDGDDSDSDDGDEEEDGDNKAKKGSKNDKLAGKLKTDNDRFFDDL